MWPLELEEVRARGTLRLVVRGDLLTAGHAGVPYDDRRNLTVVREDLHQHAREAEDRVRGLAVGGADRLGQREERPVGERVPVDQKQLSRYVSVALCHGVNVSGRTPRTRAEPGPRDRYAGHAASRCDPAPG